MSQQTYPVACACGTVHQCPAGYAGSRFMCSCGKVVEVPMLSALRTQVPQEKVTPASGSPWREANSVAAIHALARAAQLPVECECVRCGRPTSEVVTLLVECEKPEARAAVSIVVTIVLFVLFRGIGLVLSHLLASRMGGTQMVGDYIAFDLPVRVCGECKEQLADPDQARQALLATPLYARLLSQYPNTVIVESSLAPGQRMPNPHRRRKNRRLCMWLVGAWAGIAFFLTLLIITAEQLSAHGASGGEAQSHRRWILAAVAVAGIGGGVLTGWGMAKIAGSIYRHFYPDVPKQD